MTNMKEKIMQEIAAGKVAMTPRAYFHAKMAALVTLSLGVFLSSVFLFNFIFFSIRLSGQDALLGFGPEGWRAFVFFFPWGLFALDIILVFFLQKFLREFRFGYRIPVLYLLGGLMGAALLAGFTLAATTPLNERLHERRGDLPPPMRALYDGARRPPPEGSGFCRCIILAIDGSTLTVEDMRPLPGGGSTTTLTVILPEDDRRATTTGLAVGDVVFIAGEEEDGIIQAFGVRKEGDRGPRGFFKKRH